jgi:asparagine synthase (glutamine-hydrolysing)
MPADIPRLCVGRPIFQGAAAQGEGDQALAGTRWLAAFQRDAARAPAQVGGTFAVGLHMADGRVFLAVDRFAVHSLCFRVDGDRIRFAERADSLAGHDTPIDPQAIFDYLYFHVIPSPRTIYKGIYRLPPGHCAEFKDGTLKVTPYWTPNFAPATGTVSFDALRDEFRSVLESAVSQQLDGSKPACFLSGGTDSSTVAGMITKVAGRAAATYSIGFDAQGYDEMAYARIAAKHFGTDHHEYYVTPEDLVRDIPTVAAHYDQPFGNSSAVPAFCCARVAREDGVTRLLAGDGGDELFGGNSRYAKQRVFNWYGSVPGPLRTVLEPLSGLGWVQAVPGLSKAASYVQQAKVPMPDRIQTYNQLQRLGIEKVLTPEFLRQVDVNDPQGQQRQVWQTTKTGSLLDQQLAFDWRYTLAENDLPKVCGTTGLAGVEVGFPLLDGHLVDFSMRLPTAYKLKGSQLRWFFKEALRGFLPEEIIVKKKQGFGLPFGVWAHGHAALNALARESLLSLSTRGFVQPAFVRSLLDQRLAEHPGYYGEMVWILMMLEQWMREHAPDYKVCA